MIKEEDLLPMTTAKYGIEYESIIMDKLTQDYICIDDDDYLYDPKKGKQVSDNIHNLLKEFQVSHMFAYHTSLNCRKFDNSSKRLEFASNAYKPSDIKPSLMFENLGRLIEAFNEWTNEKYYLPNHGTIDYFNDYSNQVNTTVTGGTHITISFPLTVNDNPITWKIFMWLFTGLVTMYQPIYIALNGAPSPLTKGSERQRVSETIVVGSTHIYDIFTPQSNRYEIFTNTPSRILPFDYPDYAHWLSKEIDYKSKPWRDSYKGDIGNSDCYRADTFKLIESTENNDIPAIEDLIKKEFHKSYYHFITKSRSMTSNLIEFRFFDNEPINYLLEKFNLLIRIADYAYEQAKDMEEAVGIDGLKPLLTTNTDNYLNTRLLVNKKSWHDAVIESMKEGLDTTFNDEFIAECYEAFYLTDFQYELENLHDISAIQLHKLFIEKMNTSERYFSDYFQTDDPTPIYSKEYQIEMLKESTTIAEEKMKFYAEEKTRKEKEEIQIIAKLEEDRQNLIIGIIISNIDNEPNENTATLIKNYIDINKLSEILRYQIYNIVSTVEYMSDPSTSLIYKSLSNFTSDDYILGTLNSWLKKSLLPDLRQKEPILRDREDTEDRNRERDQQLQREREIIEQQINFIADIISKNITNITDETLKDLVLDTIHLRKISEILRELIYIDKENTLSINVNTKRYLYVSTLADVAWNEIPSEKQNLLIKWFRDSLLLDLISNIPELRERSQSTQTPTEQVHRIWDAIIINIRTLNIELHDLLMGSIGYERISRLLQKWIYEQSYTTSDIRDSVNEIIEKTKFRELNEAEHATIKFWIQGILINVLKTVTPIQETRTLQTEEEPEHIPLENDERAIYYSVLKSIQQIDNNAQSIIKNYIDLPKITNEIYIRIKDNYSTYQIKGLASLITQTSIFDGATIPENKKEIINAWFKDSLIPQLIQDYILIPLQETTTELLNCPEEQAENEISIILDIIKLNLDNLEHPEMKIIILKYILLNPLAKELHELIYILKYNTSELRDHSLDLLIQEGFYDELEEDYVKDPEVISLLKIWIEDYLIPDLVKGTPLELGGLDVLFG